MTFREIRPGETGFAYMDPMYQRLARMSEEKYGLPQGILDAIRTRGERSNANQVSESGARSVYQFIPQTRRGFIKNYGIDPWAGPEQATEAAALHLRDDYRRTGSWDNAIVRYHGGSNSRNWGPRTQAYARRVGSFDGRLGVQAPEIGGPSMGILGQSRYPVIDGGLDPLAPEPVKDTAPVNADAGPSMPVSAGDAKAAKRRGGLLGALESVFMPEPDSLYAAALRGGIWDAKGNQQAYKTAQRKAAIEESMAQAKLKNLLTKGEYQIAGNNIVHFPADGGEPQIITPPQNDSEKERLIDAWQNAQDPQLKNLLERMLLGANSDDVLTSKANSAAATARIRAGATTGAAQIRARNSPSNVPAIPQGWSVVK